MRPNGQGFPLGLNHVAFRLPATTIESSEPLQSDLEDFEITSELESEVSNNATDYIIADASDLPPGIFPCNLKYMDLSFLHIESKIRVSETIMIRNEWYDITKLLGDRPKGLKGSVLITGQPGIGENTSYLLNQCPHQCLFLLRENMLFVLPPSPAHHQRSADCISGRKG